MQFIALIGTAYGFLCLCFLGLRSRNFAASQVFGYVAVVTYLFLREFLHAIDHPLYAYLASLRVLVFLGPYFLWGATLSLIGGKPHPKLRVIVVTAIVAAGLFDVLSVQRHPDGLGFLLLKILSVTIPVVVTALAVRAVQRFDTTCSDAFPNQGAAPLRWLRVFVLANFLLSLCFIADELLELNGLGFRYVGLTTTAVVLFGFILFAVKNGNKFFEAKVLSTVNAINERPQRPPLPADVTKSLKERILQLLHEEKIYLDPELTINAVAERLDEKPEVLSQCIRQDEGMSFKDFVNHQRIQHCVEVLRLPGGKKSILEIAFASGFNSKATFYRYFDKVVGCTPKEFLKNLSGDPQS